MRLKLGHAAQRKAEEARQAAEGEEIFAFMSAGRRAADDEQPQPEPERGGDTEPQPEPEALPDFPPTDPDRDASLAALHAEIAAVIAGAAARNELRRELAARREEAREVVKKAFYAEVGKVPPENGPKRKSDEDELEDEPDGALTKDEQHRLKRRKERASRAVTKAFLAEHGLDAMPTRDPVVFTGGQGTGKSQAVARALAGLRSGNVLVFVPTVEKAEEYQAEIERYRPAHMFTFVWYGRTREVPESKQPPERPTAERAFLDFNRTRSERMCSAARGADRGRPAGRRQDARDLLRACPYRLDCHYLDQVDTIARHEGRRIVIVTHAMAYLPLPFTPDLIVIDEDVATKAVSVTEIGPARLLDGEKWEGAEELGAGRPPGRRRAGAAGRGAGRPARGRRHGGSPEGVRRVTSSACTRAWSTPSGRRARAARRTAPSPTWCSS